MEKYGETLVGDLYTTPPEVKFTPPSRLPVILASLGIVVILLTLLPSFMHCYHERSQKFERHREYLTQSGLCDNFLRDALLKSGEFERADVLSNVFVEKARYHELETNCEKSYIFIQQSKLFGTLDDWYTTSTMYSVLTGGNWKIQAVLAVMAIMSVRFFLNYLVRSNAINQAFSSLKSDNYAVVLDQ